MFKGIGYAIIDMNYSSSMLQTEYSIEWKAMRQAGYEVSCFTSIHRMPDLWDKLAPTDNIFLRRKYLQVLEDNPPEGMRFCYLLFQRHQKPIGLAACQIQYFNVEESLNNNENVDSPCFFSVIGRFLRGLVASKVEFTTFVCGNLLLTGENGYHFLPGTVSSSQALELIDESMDIAKNLLNGKGASINGYLIKDFFEGTREQSFMRAATKLNEFTIEPNMILNMDPKWTSYDDYLASMHSKYRVRARKAYKKAVSIEKVSFDATQIRDNKAQLYNLYRSVAENSGFNLVNLNVNYLYALKKEFKDDFNLRAYYLDGDLIAFYTTILNGDELEAHFLGINPAFNREYQVYLNILYDIVRIGIECGVERIIYARTALEIKSSVGAQPYEMYCYMRHPNAFSNKFMAPLLDYLKPAPENRIARQPFKDRERY